MRVWLLMLLLCACRSFADRPPNILLIITDDQGWFDLGVNGNSHIETPNLDRLAAQGVRFTQFYATPVCTPTRAGLLTGRYPQRSRAIDTFMGRDVLDSREVLLPELLKKKGYRTGIFGKWHLGRYMRYHPNERGFDEFFGFWQYGFINRYMDSDELFLNKEPVRTTGYITDLLTDAAISFLQRHQDQPFFLYLPYNAPHDPHLVPDAYIARYLKKGLPLGDARVYGMVTSIDDNVGRLLQTLDQLNLAQNTLIVFMSDNGGVTRFEKCGLRGNKGSVYEGGVRVPLILRWPGKLTPGKTISAMAHYLDLFPTLLEAAGVTHPPDRTIDGRNLWPLLKGQTSSSPHQYLFFQWTRVRPKSDENWAIRDTQYKLINGELFDLQSDPGESKNIAQAHPEVLTRLRTKFEEWFTEVTAGVEYSQPVPIEIGRSDENPVELDVTWATLVGTDIKHVFRRYIRDAIQNWTRLEDYASWKVSILQPGHYEVRLAYGTEPGDEGSSFVLRAGSKSLEAFTKPTFSREVYREETLGTIELESSVDKISIHPVRIPGRELMALHKVWLKRISP